MNADTLLKLLATKNTRTRTRPLGQADNTILLVIDKANKRRVGSK